MLHVSNPVPTSMPKRVRSDDSQKPAVDGKRRKKGNPFYKYVEILTLNNAIINDS